MSITLCAAKNQIPPGYVLVEAAVSGGTLEARLRCALRDAGGKVCVCIRPVNRAFSLPCTSGAGSALDRKALDALHGDAPCYFSKALCTNYFTLERCGAPYAVLFDSLESLRAKLHLAEVCGVPLALVEDSGLRKKLRPC